MANKYSLKENAKKRDEELEKLFNLMGTADPKKSDEDEKEKKKKQAGMAGYYDSKKKKK